MNTEITNNKKPERKSVLIAYLQPVLSNKELDSFDKVIIAYILSRYETVRYDGKLWQFNIKDITESTGFDRHLVSRRIKRFIELGFIVLIGKKKVGPNIQKVFALKPSKLEGFLSRDADHGIDSTAKCNGNDGVASTPKCKDEGGDGIASTIATVLTAPCHGIDSTIATVLPAPLNILGNILGNIPSNIIGIQESQPYPLPNACANGNGSAGSESCRVMSTGEAVTGSDAVKNNHDLDSSGSAVPASYDTPSIGKEELYLSGSVQESVSTGEAVTGSDSVNDLEKGETSNDAVPAKLKNTTKGKETRMTKARNGFDSLVSDVNGSGKPGSNSSEEGSIPQHLMVPLQGCVTILQMDSHLTEPLREKVIDYLVAFIKRSQWFGGNGNQSDDLVDAGSLRGKFNELHRKALEKALSKDSQNAINKSSNETVMA